MLAVAAALGLALGSACGGSPTPVAPPVAPAGPGAEPTTGTTPDMRAPIEQRRDAACDQLAPRLTACAVEDARANLAAGKIDQAQFDRDTAPEIQRKNTSDFVEACRSQPYSSRQIRVLEVCFREETRCEPLLDCLGHLNDAPDKR